MKMESLMVWKYCNYDWIWVENLWKFIARSSGVEHSLFVFGILSPPDIHKFYGIIDFLWGGFFSHFFEIIGGILKNEEASFLYESLKEVGYGVL